MWVDRYVSIVDAIILAQDEMGDDWSGEHPVFETWVKSAIEKINGKHSFDLKTNTYTIDRDNTIKLNCDEVSIEGIFHGDQTEYCQDLIDNNHGIRNIPKYIPGDGDFGNGFLFIDHGRSQPSFVSCDWKLRNGHLCFGKSLIGQKFTVLARAHKRDSDGTLMIKQTDVEAASVYILLMAARRSRWGNKETRMNKQDIDNFELRWQANMGNARYQQSKR